MKKHLANLLEGLHEKRRVMFVAVGVLSILVIAAVASWAISIASSVTMCDWSYARMVHVALGKPAAGTIRVVTAGCQLNPSDHFRVVWERTGAGAGGRLIEPGSDALLAYGQYVLDGQNLGDRIQVWLKEGSANPNSNQCVLNQGQDPKFCSRNYPHQFLQFFDVPGLRAGDILLVTDYPVHDARAELVAQQNEGESDRQNDGGPIYIYLVH